MQALKISISFEAKGIYRVLLEVGHFPKGLSCHPASHSNLLTDLNPKLLLLLWVLGQVVHEVTQGIASGVDTSKDLQTSH